MGFSHTSKIVWNTVLQISKNVESRQCGKPQKEVNIRMISFVRSIGRGHSALENFSMSLNSPAPMTKNNYRKAFKNYNAACKEAAVESLQKAAEEIRADSQEDVVDCSVSFDGAWQKRGHASHHGIVTSILVETGKCVDFEVLSNICKGCSHWEKKDKESEEYIAWKANHVCNSNHNGSASAMEPVGAVSIFEHSIDKHGLRYTNYLGDGDSSSYKNVCEAKPYGDGDFLGKVFKNQHRKFI